MEKLVPGTKREEDGSLRLETGRGECKRFHRGPDGKYLGLCGSLFPLLNSTDWRAAKVGKGTGVAVSQQRVLRESGQAGHGLRLTHRP